MWSQPEIALSQEPGSFHVNKQQCVKNTDRGNHTNWLRLVTKTDSADKSHNNET